ncbi:MAG: glycine cleavage system aminomethyltransferase GcvT [Aureliella sp.]
MTKPATTGDGNATANGSQSDLKTTALTSWHAEKGARLVEFAGYSMPVQYESIVAEHNATRNAVGAFDISHMARIRFEGPRAHELLDHLLTRRVTDMKTGMVRYSLMCNEQGGILDDVLVSNLETPSSKQYFLLVVNAANHQKIIQWITPHLADYPDVACNDVTEMTTMIAVQGPGAVATVNRLVDYDVSALGYYRATVCDQMQKPIIVSRTGYTGEDGYELIVRNEDAPRVWENVMLSGREHGVAPVGLAARDTLRLEAGMPLYGHELGEDIDPITAGLGFAANVKDREFIGRDALAKLKAVESDCVRVGLKLAGRRAARQGAGLVDDSNRTVGHVTSGTFSPTLSTPIAMAYLPRELATIGMKIDVDIRGSKTTAEIVEIPFYRRKK